MSDTDFIYGVADLPADKVNRDGTTGPVTNPTRRWSADDASRTLQALRGMRTVANDEWISVQKFGAVGDGVTDDTAAIQAALNANEGRRLHMPLRNYKVTSTIFITQRSQRIVGDFGNRFAQSGTEITFTGTGPCFQIGTDNGHNWDANEYDGFQDQVFENLWIRHGAPDTALVSAGDAVLRYKAGAYGIWDWRGGGITMRNVGIEQFEANFVGIQSDINNFDIVTSAYSKYGFYIGPRSDQNTIERLYSFFCDRAVTIDRAGKTRINNAQIVGCGTSTAAPIEVRQGSYATTIQSAWFEHLQGYQGVDQLSFVSAGEVAGYGAGGSIQSPGGTPTTTPASGLAVLDPMVISVVAAQATHTKYLISAGKCQSILLDHPVEQINSSLSNFDALVGVPNSGLNPSNADTQIEIRGIPGTLAVAKIYVNLSAGAPAVDVQSAGSAGRISYSTGRYHFGTLGAAAGADDVQISQESNVGEVWLSTPNKPTGQVTRLRLARSRQTTFVANGPPAAGTWEQGDRVDVLDAVQTGFAGFYCWIAGTPGTWAPYGKIEGRELAAPVLGANQNDYNPASLGPTKALILTASTPVNITGIVAGLVVAGSSGSTGEEMYVYNNGANNITLTHQDVASTAANRIIGRGNANVVLTPATGVLLYYSPSITRWLVMGDTL